MDRVANDAQIYTDVQGLEQLRYQAKMKNPAAKKEVAKQFEALLLQQVLQSMNNANKEMSGGLFGSDQMDMYQDLYSKQLAILITQQDLGFAKIVEENINQQYHLNDDKVPDKVNTDITSMPKPHLFKPIIATTNANQIIQNSTIPPAAPANATFNTQEEFVKGLWSAAKVAAKTINADPRILMAQAALETDWGKKILHFSQRNSTNNLFNIKADSSWKNKSLATTTLEEHDGVVKKENASFRAYGSYFESFMDYAQFLKGNDRYSQAMSNASNPSAFVHALQSAGFATDQNYATKIMEIMHSDSFNSLIKHVENDF